MIGAEVGHCALYVSAYSVLALGILLILQEHRDIALPNSELSFIVVAIMGSIHTAFSTYVNRRSRGSST